MSYFSINFIAILNGSLFLANNSIDKFYEECAINNFFEKSQKKVESKEHFQTAVQKFELLPVPRTDNVKSLSSQKKKDPKKSLKLVIGRVAFIKKFRDDHPSEQRIYETYGKIVRMTRDLKITIFLRDLAGGPVIQFFSYDPEIVKQDFEPNELVKVVGDLLVGSNLQFIKIWKISNYPTKFEFEKIENKAF